MGYVGNLGCSTPEILAKYSIFQRDKPGWSEAGDQLSQIFQDGDLSSRGNSSLTHAKFHPCPPRLPGAVDGRRCGLPCQPSWPCHEGLNLRPGGPFVPLGLANDPDSLTELKVQETENGRLAIFSVLAYVLQVIVPGEGPAANWVACRAHLLGTNGLSLAVMGQFAPSPVAMFAASGHNAAEFPAWYGSDCSEWQNNERPTSVYLTGVYPGDYRWGTADLVDDQTTLQQYREAELIHARWAVLQIMGSLPPEILAKFAGSQFSGPACFSGWCCDLPGG